MILDSGVFIALDNPARRRVVLALLQRMQPVGDPRAIGARCGSCGTSDVVDASLAVLADQLDQAILTSDPTDMTRLGARHEVP